MPRHPIYASLLALTLAWAVAPAAEAKEPVVIHVQAQEEDDPLLTGPISVDDNVLGALNLSLNTQSLQGLGFMPTLRMTGVTEDLGEIRAELGYGVGTPSTRLRMGAAFIGALQLGNWLPVNPILIGGLDGQSYFDFGATDIAIWLDVPVGVRYVVPLGALKLGAEASYHYNLYTDAGKNAIKPTHTHYEVFGRYGALHASGYFDQGVTYNGPGVQVGLTF